jgi:hypothetical protein
MKNLLERRGGRWPNVLALRYAAQYRVSLKSVHRQGVAQLVRMQPHARATIFSTLKWQQSHRGAAVALRRKKSPWRVTPEDIDKLVALAEKKGA